MKNAIDIPIIFTLAFLVFTVNINARVVDESINGIQTGFLGVWWNNETKIATRWAMRFEIGYEAPPFYSFVEGDDALEIYSVTTKNKYPVFAPVLSLEPRWYYNSSKRQGNSKNTFHNSGNYATIALRYYPKILALSPYAIKDQEGGIFIVPTWGIRRNISYRLNFELGLGFGIDILDPVISKNDKTEDFLHDIVFNIHLRFGYKFGKL